MDPLDEAPWADTPQTSTTTSQQDTSQASAATAKSAASSSSARPSRLTPRRLVAQPTRLQAVEDDPLGPLGASASSDAAAGPAAGGAGAAAESPPAPPLKEQLPLRTTLPQSPAASSHRRGPADPHQIDDDDDGEGGFDGAAARGPRVPPPVVAAQPSPVRTTARPSVSVEQAAKPSFHIVVGDPHKVGGATSSHIEYSVRTKVRRSSTRFLSPLAGEGKSWLPLLLPTPAEE